MKIAFAILVLTCHACLSEATLQHLKAKLKLSPLIQPAERYKYEVPPAILPEPVPVVYSPISTFSPHASTYSAVPHYAPSYAAYRSPVYSLPVVYRSTVAVPVSIYKKPLVIYEESPVVHYEEPPALSLEAPAFGIEEHYSTYGDSWKK